MLLFKQVEIPDFDLGVDFVDTLTGHALKARPVCVLYQI